MRLKSEYKIRNIAGENVIVSIGTLDVNLTKVISLNDTSVWLWEQLQGVEFDDRKVSSLLTENYDIDQETALQDAKAWIASLRKAGLVDEE